MRLTELATEAPIDLTPAERAAAQRLSEVIWAAKDKFTVEPPPLQEGVEEFTEV